MLAHDRCTTCWGTGRRPHRLCDCVLRAIFRSVRRAIEEPKRDPYCPRQTGISKACSYPDIEYSIDVESCARKHLTPEEYRIYRLRYIAGADWRTATEALGMDRGLFHHACYRTEAKLGRAWLEAGLYPLYEYFRARRPATVQHELKDLPPQRWFQEAIFERVMAAAA